MWEIIGALAGALVMILGYITWIEKKKDKRWKEKKKMLKHEIFTEMNEILDEDLDSLNKENKKEIGKNLEEYVQKREVDTRFKEILNGLTKLDEKLESHFIETKQSEIERLSTEILNYHEDLVNKLWKTPNSYRHISKCFDRYKRLGGNSFIGETFSEIREMMGEQNEKNQ